MAGAQSTSHAPSEKELTQEHSFIYLIVKKVFHLRPFQIHPVGRAGYLAAHCSHCTYISSWNLTSLTISDAGFTNILPPKMVDGYGYIFSYTDNYPRSLFEAKCFEKGLPMPMDFS